MDQVLQYLKNAEKVLKANQFSDDEEYNLFLQNVFSELDGMEYRLACSHDGSALLELFLQNGSDFHLAVFFDRLAGKYEALAGHRYGSHVLEKIFVATGKALAAGKNGLKGEAAEEGLLPLDKQVIRAYEELKASIIDAIHDSYGSHVWRALVSLFTELPGYFSESLADLAKSLLEMDEGTGQGFRDLAINKNAAPFFQHLLRALSTAKSPILIQILSKMVHGFDFENAKNDESCEQAKKYWKSLMEHENGSHTAEVIIDVLSATQIQVFYSCLIRGNSAALLQHTKANFPLQHLVKAFRNAAQIQIILDEIDSVLPHLIESRRFGIIIKFAEWVVEHKAVYEEVYAACLKVFGLEKTAEDRQLLFNCALYLQVKGSPSPSTAINAQGCALLSMLARFPENVIRETVNGLLKCNEEQILSMARHPASSRSLESFFSSGVLGAKALQRIGRHLKGHLSSLACDKYGSHVVERLWSFSPLQAKNIMMEELAASKEKLESSPHGRMVIRNCRVEQFSRKREDWIKEEQTKTTKRALFEDILND